MSVCMNCGTHGPEDMDVISHLIKIRLKPKVLLNHYMLCVRCARRGEAGRGEAGRGGGRRGQPSHSSARPTSRELLNAHKDNLGTTIKFVIFNELSNARNPNNMQTLYAVLQHSSALAPKVGARRGLTPATPAPRPGWRRGHGGGRRGAKPCVRGSGVGGPGAGPGRAAGAGRGLVRGLWEDLLQPGEDGS